MQRLRIAIQKSGRLSDLSQNLFAECGISVPNGKTSLIGSAANFPIDLLFLRDDDIPQYVEEGIADAGIVGEDVLTELEKEVVIAKKLGFGKCRLSLAVPKSEIYQDLSFFSGKRIATSFPNILRKFLIDNHIRAEIHEISGSVEIAPSIGLAEAICDLVSSGSTLLSNGLKEVATVLQSQALLINHKNLSAEKQQIVDKLLFRIEAVYKAKACKYIILNAPNSAISGIIGVLPGMKSPTVVPLAMEGWSAIHSVLPEETFWDMIDQLKEKGAQGILVVPIEKMIL